MAVKQYVITFCLTAVCLASVAFASPTTENPTTSEASINSTVATDSSTTQSTTQSTAQATAQSTDPASTATPRNISCHNYSCELAECLQNATDKNLVGSCNTPGNCFVKRTSNDTYTKEEVGCDDNASTCMTTIHDNGDGKRICCTTDNCNNVITLLNQQSNAPSITSSVGITVSLLLLCVNTL